MSEHRLFISWSKELASNIAPLLRDFCEDILGFSEIFLSQDIDSGRRWGNEIASALESCDAGLIIVTSENLNAQWLNFEAGAISKKVKDANVIPLLWDVSVGDLSGSPLNQFQSKHINREGLWEVVQALGQLWSVNPDGLERRFEKNWPTLETELASLPAAKDAKSAEVAIEDVFSMLQRLDSQFAGMEKSIEALKRATFFTLENQYKRDLNRKSPPMDTFFQSITDALSGTDKIAAKSLSELAAQDRLRNVSAETLKQFSDEQRKAKARRDSHDTGTEAPEE